MANYLPVLLVSVNANAIPDDNVLTNVPCGQVDYLSHDWQEEDVWRSWRNMTRQKNEITNGLRLENASWRTWWKQRNKLKTVSPETLNWLKDSDVTWLYGPLHTAVDWSPPPKPDPVPDSVDRTNPPSTQDRLDLHSSPAKTPCQPQPPPTKPILKHRSISELLTFDLPVSPIFSPHDSDNDDVQSSTQSLKRPCLPHTKSDTHITRWGPSRAIRRDSPPRVSSPARKSTTGAPGAVRPSLSQDSTSSASASGSTERPPKRKHISFNTFVEQRIAIDKHHPTLRRRAGFGFGDYFNNEFVYDDQGEDGDDRRWEDDDGYEEDREDNLFDEDDPLWLAAHGGARPRRRHLNESAIHSDSDSDDGVIEIRPSTYRHSNLGTPHAKKKNPPRSKSASSSSSATTSTTTSSTSSSSTGFRQRRKSASAVLDGVFSPNLLSVPPQTSAYRPRPSHADPPYRDRVTIAPIAPTFLKTTGVWEEGFGDEGGASDDGLWDYGVPTHGVNSRSGGGDDTNKRGSKYDEEQSSDGTPVELVYVPPFGSIYGYTAQTYWRNRRGQVEDIEDEEDEMTEHVEEIKPQFPTSEDAQKNHLPQKEDCPASAPLIPQEPAASVSRSPIPVVIVDSSADSDSTPSDCDKNECNLNSSNSTSTTTTPVPVPSQRFQSQEERGRGRGRSLSISPVGGSSNSSKPPAPAPAPSSSSSNGTPLTSRGRSQSCQDLQSFYNPSVTTTSIQNGERRGRSSMRGPSTGSNSASIRGINSSRSSQSHSGGRSGGSVSPYNSSTSPIGSSLSPDGGDARLGSGIGSAYASGRMGGRERESRFERNSSSSSLSSKATSTGSDERRGRDRGRRDVGSGSGSSTSPIASTSSPEESRGRSGRSTRGREGGERECLSPQDVFDIEPVSTSTSSSPVTIIAAGTLGGNTREEASISFAEGGTMTNDAPKMEMDASICSVSSEGSTATIVPTSNVVSPKHKVAAVKAQVPITPTLIPLPPSTREVQFEREALEEADRWRKNVPTPSNSPTKYMTAPTVTPGTAPTRRATLPSIQTQSIEYSPKHVRTSSSSSAHSSNSPSSSKYKPKSPPIAPSPSHPALPSTSSSYAPGEVGTSSIFTTSSYIRSASTSLERASSGSRERQSPSSSTAGSSSSSSTTPHAGSGLRKEITPDREFEREQAEARRGRNGDVCGRTTKMWMNGNGGAVTGAVKEPTSPVMDGGYGRERETIINKAVGMVSSAGAYLKLWPGQNYGAGAAQ